MRSHIFLTEIKSMEVKSIEVELPMKSKNYKIINNQLSILDCSINWTEFLVSP